MAAAEDAVQAAGAVAIAPAPLLPAITPATREPPPQPTAGGGGPPDTGSDDDGDDGPPPLIARAGAAQGAGEHEHGGVVDSDPDSDDAPPPLVPRVSLTAAAAGGPDRSDMDLPRPLVARQGGVQGGVPAETPHLEVGGELVAAPSLEHLPLAGPAETQSPVGVQVAGAGSPMLNAATVASMLGAAERHPSQSALHIAASLGDTEALAVALRSAAVDGYTADAFLDAEGRTPLHYAAVSGAPACVDLLLADGGAAVLAADSNGHTALHWAACHGRAQAALALLTGGASAGAADREGATPLHWAATSEAKTLQAILGVTGQAMIDSRDRNNMTPLHWSAYHNQPKLLALLLKKDADPQLTDNQGCTALHWACEARKDSACAKLLLRKEPSLVNVQDAQGQTALHRAVANNSVPVLQRLVGTRKADLEQEDAYGRTAVQWACALGHAKACQVLLSAGASDAHQDTELGASALHYAAQGDFADCIKILLHRRRRSASNLQDGEGRTALTWAVMQQHQAAARAILGRQGFDVDLADATGKTPLHYAAVLGFDAIVPHLLKRAADLDAVDNGGQTPLVCAVEFAQIDTIRTLLDHKPSLDRADVEGRSPLIWAVSGGLDAAAELLVDAGANLDQADARGETPLHFACFFGHEHLVHALILDGANPNLQDHEGATPLHWAAMQGNVAVVRTLLQGDAYPNFLELEGHRPTPLDHAYDQSATSASHAEIAQLLLDSGGMVSYDIQLAAVTIVQKYWRRTVAIQELNRRKFHRDHKEQIERRASQTLTRAFRRVLSQRQLAGTSFPHRKATQIQARWRGHLVRRRLKKEIRDFKAAARRKVDAERRRRRQEAMYERTMNDPRLARMARQANRSKQALAAERARKRQSQAQTEEERQARAARDREFQERYEAEKVERLRLFRQQMEREARRHMREMQAEQAAAERRKRTQQRTMTEAAKYRGEARLTAHSDRHRGEVKLTPEQRAHSLVLRTVSTYLAAHDKRLPPSRRNEGKRRRSTTRLQALAQPLARRRQQRLAPPKLGIPLPISV